MDSEVGNTERGSRKRKVKYTEMKGGKKTKRYSDSDPKLGGLHERPCNHNSKAFKCHAVTNADLVNNRATFYQVPDKISQDRTLSRFLGVCEPERRRKKDITAQKKTPKVSVKYYFNTAAHGRIPVCQIFFFVSGWVLQNLEY